MGGLNEEPPKINFGIYVLYVSIAADEPADDPADEPADEPTNESFKFQ